jgi:predicted DCC family thiol-disulfide oxidoreductase YuxK
MTTNPPSGTVYFDGYCGLCDRFVSFLLTRDRHHRLRFTPLQGETAASRLGVLATDQPPETVLYEDGAGMHQRSTAALRTVIALGGIWRATGILLLVPRPVRDLLYDWVARHRFRWFGRRDSCRLPTPEERTFFLP